MKSLLLTHFVSNMGLVSAIGLCLLARGARADVLTVGAAGMFTHLQPAVDAAADGDVILVRAGTYSAFTVDHKSLVIAADPPGSSVTTGKITVQNLSAAQHCSLSGIHVTGFAVPLLVAQNNAGSLRCQALSLTGSATYPTPAGDVAALSNCQDVALTDCTLTGADGVFHGPFAGVGLSCSLSNVAVYGGSLQGGSGFNGFQKEPFIPINPESGAAGCSVNTSTFFCAGVAIHGGSGGWGYTASCTYHYPGGNGAMGGTGLVESSGSAYVLDASITGGLGGAGGNGNASCSQPNGSPGSTGVDKVGSVTTIAGAQRTLVAPTLVRELTPLDLSVTGAPGDVVWLSVARHPRWVFSPARKGVLLNSAEARTFSLGTIPVSGVLQASLPIQDLGPATQSSTVFLQASCVSSAGDLTLTNPAVVVLLDQAF